MKGYILANSYAQFVFFIFDKAKCCFISFSCNNLLCGMDEKILHNLIIDYIDSPIWLINEHYELLAYNESFARVFGRVRRDVDARGGNFMEVFSDVNEIELWKSAIYQTLVDGKYKFNYQVKSNGKRAFFEIKTLLINGEGDNKQISIIANDITETKDFEKKLERQNAEFKKINLELDNFVYSVSHQIRSPLTSLLGLINIAKIDTPEKIYEYLDLMQVSIENLDHTVHEINDYSRNARVELKIEKVSFREIWDKIIEEYSSGKKLNAFDIKCNIEEPAYFYSDASRIKVIISNIFSNSLKFNDLEKERSNVNIDIKVNKQVAKITVSDNGEGMHEESLPKIFDMFYRGSQSARGAGLGLYVVKEIVNKLKGKIEVESELGKGSKFTIELPGFDSIDS